MSHYSENKERYKMWNKNYRMTHKEYFENYRKTYKLGERKRVKKEVEEKKEIIEVSFTVNFI